MSSHVFVDETKHRGYVLVASVVVPSDLDTVRQMMRGLVLAGQRRLQMKDENDQRRRSIAAAISVSGVTATIYDAGRRYRNERERRAVCLHALIIDVTQRGDVMLVLEQDETLLSWDNQRLIDFIREAGCRDTLRYEHRRAASELLLAVPGAIAWSWARGGDLATTHRTGRHGGAGGLIQRGEAKPERRGRPAGSRAHFLKLNATGATKSRAPPGRSSPDLLSRRRADRDLIRSVGKETW